MEGLPLYVEEALGTVPDELEVIEAGARFMAPVRHGQKTGWFYDQAYNRPLLGPWVQGARVLDVFCYAGAWGIQAARQGAAEVTCIDSSAAALATVQRKYLVHWRALVRNAPVYPTSVQAWAIYNVAPRVQLVPAACATASAFLQVSSCDYVQATGREGGSAYSSVSVAFGGVATSVALAVFVPLPSSAQLWVAEGRRFKVFVTLQAGAASLPAVDATGLVRVQATPGARVVGERFQCLGSNASSPYLYLTLADGRVVMQRVLCPNDAPPPPGAQARRRARSPTRPRVTRAHGRRRRATTVCRHRGRTATRSSNYFSALRATASI
jgi:hypothetical protein